MKTVSSTGEFGLIHQLTRKLKLNPGVVIGVGDDSAVVRFGKRPGLLTTDLLIEDVHFRRKWMSPREIGFKAMRVNLSDIAAMGGRPLYALISVGMPKSFSQASAKKLFEGLRAAGEETGCSIVGGDTNAADRLILNVAVVGEAGKGKVLTRNAARVDDEVYVTGTLGGSSLGLRALKRNRRRGFEAVIRQHVVPPLRIAVGQSLARLRGVHAMIDVSDGLVGDLGHILEQSGVGAVVEVERLPAFGGSSRFNRWARDLKMDPFEALAGGGEDYELLFTVSPRVKMPHKIHGVPVTKIGRITRKTELRFLTSDGRAVHRPRSYRHF